MYIVRPKRGKAIANKERRIVLAAMTDAEYSLGEIINIIETRTR